MTLGFHSTHRADFARGGRLPGMEKPAAADRSRVRVCTGRERRSPGRAFAAKYQILLVFIGLAAPGKGLIDFMETSCYIKPR